MLFNENLINLRKSRGWSQEELGYKVDVSRQTVSKWETGETTPEMSKLVKLSQIFQLSIDALVGEEDHLVPNPSVYGLSPQGYEYKSKRQINGIPLIHINWGRGLRKAVGVIAIGNVAMGVLSIGLLSLGLFSIGLLSLGLIALGALSLGGISIGGLTTGIFAIGGITTGYVAIGGIARGFYTVGGISIARNIAIGGIAQGQIAIGKSVKGTVEFITENNFEDIDFQAVKAAIERTLPQTPQWIKSLFTGNNLIQ